MRRTVFTLLLMRTVVALPLIITVFTLLLMRTVVALLLIITVVALLLMRTVVALLFIPEVRSEASVDTDRRLFSFLSQFKYQLHGAIKKNILLFVLSLVDPLVCRLILSEKTMKAV